MKKFSFFMVALAFMGLSRSVTAQEVAMLHQNGSSYLFEGANSLIAALDSAQNGDTVYLSAGSFNSPTALNKGVTVVGAGHFPDVTKLKKRTTLSAALTINAGADGLHLEGLYINGNVTFQQDASINDVTIKRCRIDHVSFNSTSETTSKNNCRVEECYVFTGISQGISYAAWGPPALPGVGNNLQIVRNVIMRGGYGSNASASLLRIVNAVIYRNIFLGSNNYYYSYFYDVNNSVCTGNIFISHFGLIASLGGNNQFENNVFNNTDSDFGNSTSNNNYFGIPQESIFINQIGYDINYNHDYHLQNPELYLGSDGTQVGLYGGSIPFKEAGSPFNPQVIEKNIGAEALPNGTLPLNIKVQAQER